MNKHWLAACVCAVFLIGCGGGSGGASDNPNPTPQPTGSPAPTPGQFACSPVGGGSATLASFCLQCPGDAVTDPQNAIDTQLDSAATVRLYNWNDTAGAQSVIDIKATAQSGVAFSAGGKAGLLFGLPDSFLVPFSGSISTYQDDALIDSRSFSSDEFLGQEGQTTYLGLDTTTATFNAVKLSLTQAGGGLEEQQFRLYEFCADGAAASK